MFRNNLTVLYTWIIYIYIYTYIYIYIHNYIYIYIYYVMANQTTSTDTQALHEAQLGKEKAAALSSRAQCGGSGQNGQEMGRSVILDLRISKETNCPSSASLPHPKVLASPLTNWGFIAVMLEDGSLSLCQCSIDFVITRAKKIHDRKSWISSMANQNLCVLASCFAESTEGSVCSHVRIRRAT